MDIKSKNIRRKRWTVASIVVGTIAATLLMCIAVFLSKLYLIYYDSQRTLPGVAKIIDHTWFVLMGVGAVFLAAWLIGTLMCGQKDEQGNIKVATLNYFPVEIFFITFSLGVALACVPGLMGLGTGTYDAFSNILIYKVTGMRYITAEFNDVPGVKSIEALLLILIAGSALMSILSYLCIVIKIKSKTFLSTTFVGIIYRHLHTSANEHKAFSRHLLYKMIVAICIFAAVEIILYIIMGLAGVIICIIVAIVAAVKLDDKISLLRAGIKEVRNGNLNYRVELDEKDSFSDIADDINHISEAVAAAIDRELTNERLKSELISNVSHDIKTPLTSMITYIDLMKREGLASENAPEYLDIIESKTMRLKKLTDDLFEAAKVSSGVIPVELASIDLAAMTEQMLVELGDKLEKARLDVIFNKGLEDATVEADGNLMFRVMENLIVNISKYSLLGSRVYVDIVPGENDTVQLKMKNISRDILNISPEELMERFTRGEKSRTTEGSGLGLAITKDLVELQGGRFFITIEGDLFMVTVELKRKNVYN